MPPHSPLEMGFQVSAIEGGETFGAVRGNAPQANALVSRAASDDA
jgi:hypothetical protein